MIKSNRVIACITWIDISVSMRVHKLSGSVTQICHWHIELSIFAMCTYHYFVAPAGPGKLHSNSGSGQVKTAGAPAGLQPPVHSQVHSCKIYTQSCFKIFILKCQRIIMLGQKPLANQNAVTGVVLYFFFAPLDSMTYFYI